MKMCQEHWNQLKAKIEASDYAWMIASCGEEAVERMSRELAGKFEKLDFDPLMAAHNMIVSNALRVGGLGIMFGEKCPVCELNAPDWIARAADDAIKAAQDLMARKEEP